MTLDDFRLSLTATAPPAGLTLALAGLWWDAKGDWTRAHESAQQDEGRDGAWVHAYLQVPVSDFALIVLLAIETSRAQFGIRPHFISEICRIGSFVCWRITGTGWVGAML